MHFFSEARDRLESLCASLGGEVCSADLAATMSSLEDEAVVEVLTDVSALGKVLDAIRIAAVGVAAARSSRDRGHGGLAQGKGHRTTTSLVQELTGTTRADAATQVRLGEALLAGLQAQGVDLAEVEAAPVPWHAPLGVGLLESRITAAQHDAILRGLGQPPVAGMPEVEAAAWADAWTLAAQQLIEDAPARTVEDLLRAARAVRDTLDPEGASRRFDERFAARSFRLWQDADGIHRASISLDDEMAAWVRTIIDSALRPRKGGPRFVDPEERARAEDLVKDPRTNDQLTYDLIFDTLRAGALADEKQVFGTRQAGVRVVITAGALHHVPEGGQGAGFGTVSGARGSYGAPDAVGHLEDDGSTLPAWLVRQRLCDTGEATGILDRTGNPLYLGREQRLFSPKQRLGLSLRDGGCRWHGCDRPASYCESHHIDHYVEHEGRTDIDRGILLCRFHHMNLHHGGWRITRRGREDFFLHPPGGDAAWVLPAKLRLRYAWAGIQPPPARFRAA